MAAIPGKTRFAVLILIALIALFTQSVSHSEDGGFEIVRTQSTRMSAIEIPHAVGLVYKYRAPEGAEFLEVTFWLRSTGDSKPLMLKKENLRLLVDGKEAIYYGMRSSSNSDVTEGYPNPWLTPTETSSGISVFVIPLSAMEIQLEIEGQTAALKPESSPKEEITPIVNVTGSRFVSLPRTERHEATSQKPERIIEIDTDGAQLISVDVEVTPTLPIVEGIRFSVWYKSFWLSSSDGWRSPCIGTEKDGQLRLEVHGTTTGPREGSWAPMKSTVWFLAPKRDPKFTIHYGNAKGIPLELKE